MLFLIDFSAFSRINPISAGLILFGERMSEFLSGFFETSYPHCEHFVPVFIRLSYFVQIMVILHSAAYGGSIEFEVNVCVYQYLLGSKVFKIVFFRNANFSSVW